MTAGTDLRRRVERFWHGPVAWEAPLAERTTFRVGGPAAALIEPGSTEEIRLALAGCLASGIPWLVMGGGSNLLGSDEGFAGLVLLLGRKFGGISETGSDAEGSIKVRVEAGCSLARLLEWSRERGLSGLEFTVGIPGSVGGAVMMNAGACGGEIQQVLAALRWLENERIVEKERSELAFAYRSWRGPAEAVVLTATFALRTESSTVIEARCREWSAARRSRQPKGVPSAGSFFKNPPGDFAGRLIESAGLKGATVRSAMVSEVHANFLVNTGGATAADILALMRLVQERVREEYGVWLEPEVRIVGPGGQEI